MKPKAIYMVLTLLIVAAFLGGYFLAVLKNSGEKEGALEKKEAAIQLKAGEDEYRLDGIIISVNPEEISPRVVVQVTPDPKRFITLPPPTLRKTVYIIPNLTKIIEGKLREEETVPIDLTELKPKDIVLIKTQESILDILNRDSYQALFIKKVIIEE